MLGENERKLNCQQMGLQWALKIKFLFKDQQPCFDKYIENMLATFLQENAGVSA